MQALKNAYRIVDMFREMVEEEVTPKLQILLMSDEYQDLRSACGYIGGIIESQEPNQIYEQLIVTNEDTRAKLVDAYQACHLVCENIIEDSDLFQAVTYLKSCFYIILNATYKQDSELQDRIGNMFEICDHGLEALDTIESVSDTDCNNVYLNQSGQRIHPRVSQLRDAFTMLQPKMKEKEDKGEKENEESD